MALLQSTDKAKFSLKNTIHETKTNDKSVKPTDIEHIIVIGNTGLGKSSLIKLLTKNNQIKTANTGDSCTSDTQAYPLTITDKNHNNTVIHALIYDTQGTQDTKSNDNDENSMTTGDSWKKDSEVLNQIQRFIYESNGIQVKFIWVVPSMERMQSDLQRQARFINKFTSQENFSKTNNNNNNSSDNTDDDQDEKKQDAATSQIWTSVLMIVHKPEQGADLIDECAKGAIRAANKYGNNNKEWVENKNIIGYCNIDWLPQTRQKKAKKYYNMQLAQKDPTLFYYYKSDEIESLVLQSLLLLPSTSIEWSKDKCIKCDWIGDKRFCNDIPCHTRSYWSHKMGTKAQLKHLGVLDENYCDRYHTGELVSLHPQSIPIKKYHPGKQCRRPATIMETGTYMARMALTGIRRDNASVTEKSVAATVLVFNTVTLNLMFGLGPAIASAFEDEDERIPLEYYDCCDANELTLKYWDGCTPVVSNSNKQNVKGYLCCMKEEGSEGCKKYYKCCPYDDEKAQGCAKQCTNCNTDVNDGDRDSKQAESAKGNKCGFYWPCCGHKGKIGAVKNDELKCTKYCTFCDKEWGKSKGCSSNQKHNFNSVGTDEHEDEKKNYNRSDSFVGMKSVGKQVKKLIPRKNIINPLIIIVCIEKYQDENKNILTARKDYNNWIELFDKHLKFGKNINIIKNDIDKPLNKNDFLDFINSAFIHEKLRDNSKKYDSIIFTYSGHGKFKDKIYFSDEKCLSLESIFSKFDGDDDNLQSFVGLPKIFIIDMCRGNGVSIGIRQQVFQQNNGNTGKNGNGLKFRVADEIDYNPLYHHRDNSFIKVFSITKGNASPDTGYLVEYLCQTMKDKGIDLKTTCFHDLVKIADLRIREQTKSASHCVEYISTAAFETYFKS